MTDRASDPRYKACHECGAFVQPARGYLGGDVKCAECADRQIAENTI